MIDIHCHILPSVDDGPKSLEESLVMARAAVQDGIKTIIATPHHRNNQYLNIKSKIIEEVTNLNEELKKVNIPLKVLPGQEIRIYGELIEDYHKGEILTLNSTRYMFIEFPSSTVPRYAEKLLFDLQLEGIIPIIVHPERNKEFQQRPELLYMFVKNGALTQLTASSIIGLFGNKVKKFSGEIINCNLVHFIASDAHNLHNRSFKMIETHDFIDEHYGLDYRYFFTENSKYLLEDKNIMREVPEPIKRKKFLGVF